MEAMAAAAKKREKEHRLPPIRVNPRTMLQTGRPAHVAGAAGYSMAVAAGRPQRAVKAPLSPAAAELSAAASAALGDRRASAVAARQKRELALYGEPDPLYDKPVLHDGRGPEVGALGVAAMGGGFFSPPGGRTFNALQSPAARAVRARKKGQSVPPLSFDLDVPKGKSPSDL